MIDKILSIFAVFVLVLGFGVFSILGLDYFGIIEFGNNDAIEIARIQSYERTIAAQKETISELIDMKSGIDWSAIVIICFFAGCFLAIIIRMELKSKERIEIIRAGGNPEIINYNPQKTEYIDYNYENDRYLM